MSSLGGIFHMGAPCPPWLKEAWCGWLGPEKVWECYGATEAQCWTLLRGDEWRKHPKVDGMILVGPCLVGLLKIVDPETKKPLPAGQVGEVWAKHQDGLQTYKYFGAQSEPDEDGWETVGDMGMLDDQGFLHLGDRKKDMVLVGGVNIYPAEVEAALEQHPKVKSCLVVGIPDQDLGQRLHGVVFTGSESVQDEELRGFLTTRLDRKKIPKSFSRAAEHLRGEDGKARRSQLAASLAAAAPALDVPSNSSKL